MFSSRHSTTTAQAAIGAGTCRKVSGSSGARGRAATPGPRAPRNGPRRHEFSQLVRTGRNELILCIAQPPLSPRAGRVVLAVLRHGREDLSRAQAVAPAARE